MQTFNESQYRHSTSFKTQRKVKRGTVDTGLAGGAPGEAAAFIAMGHLTFESVDAFQQAFGPNAEEILADIPNLTNAQPQVQISEIKL